MPRLFHLTVIAAIATMTPAVAHACDFLLRGETGMTKATLDDAPEGIAAGMFWCGGDNYGVQLWTLVVDPQQADLGIRDGKLFDTTTIGPLTELLSAQIENHARVSVHERTETVSMQRSPIPRGWHSFRRFVSFCDLAGTGDPLDCSLGAARIKAYSTAKDSDLDGYLDYSLHEISYYDGASKLHVLRFVTPYSKSVTADVGIWIEAINAVSDVLKPTS